MWQTSRSRRSSDSEYPGRPASRRGARTCGLGPGAPPGALRAAQGDEVSLSSDQVVHPTRSAGTRTSDATSERTRPSAGTSSGGPSSRSRRRTYRRMERRQPEYLDDARGPVGQGRGDDRGSRRAAAPLGTASLRRQAPPRGVAQWGHSPAEAPISLADLDVPSDQRPAVRVALRLDAERVGRRSRAGFAAIVHLDGQ
jgi:hypothetical protein